MDERKAGGQPNCAVSIPIGTLTILDVADRRALVDFELGVSKLKATNFHVDPDLVEFLLEESRMRKQRKSVNPGRSGFASPEAPP